MLRTLLLWSVTLRDLDPESTRYGVYISINTNKLAWHTSIRWEAGKLIHGRQITKSTDFDRTWPDMWRHNLMIWHNNDLKFFRVCIKLINAKFDWVLKSRCDLPRFTRVLRKKKHGGLFDPYTSARALVSHILNWAVSRRIRVFLAGFVTHYIRFNQLSS